MRITLIYLATVLGITFFTTQVNAVEVNNAVVSNIEVSEQNAKSFGLEIEELTRYSHIMRGPKGTFYRRGDTNIYRVLGSEATTREERRRYALLYRDAMHDYHNKLEEWIDVLGEVNREKFGPNPRIFNLTDTPDFQSASSAQPLFKRMKMYVLVEGCVECERAVKVEINKINDGLLGGLDLYFVGNNVGTKEIRHWAKRNEIDVDLVSSRVVTLNHDDKQSRGNSYPVKIGELW
jgi:integrating conjugative element protein (TIGR03759 family)